MCGIACVIELGNRAPSRDALSRLSKSLTHRGPDDDGMLVHMNVGMVFRRLAIIDLSKAGHQPMLSDSGRYAIVFNGEIFNYLELRTELEAKGHVFRSSSDTEVLLNAYIEWKEACLERLNGMWAFVILDTESGECFCARDRFGIKPLYVMKSSNRIVLASEVSAILRSGLYEREINRTTIARYLHFGDLDHSNNTFYEGINAVPPGTWLSIDKEGNVHSKQYWALPQDTQEIPDHEALCSLFHDAVRIRLRSDVPVGVFLSGGLDSTSILCAAAGQMVHDHSLSAYSFMPPEYDETRYINDTIKQTGARLVPLEIDSSTLWGQLERMTGYQDGPVHTPSALIGFCLCGLAATEGTKVILNGQGADETLAGYGNYFASFWQSLLTERRFGRLKSQLKKYGAHYDVQLLALLKQVVMRFARSQLNHMHAYRWMAAIRRRNELRTNPLYSRDLVDDIPKYRGNHGDRGIGAVLRESVTATPLPLYLRVEDRNSMAHSIEIRLPFLDYRLVNAVMRIVGTRKLDGFWNKVLLREFMRAKIPESVRTRPDKMGFETPDAKWIRAWAPEIEAMFRSRSFAERGFFNAKNLLLALQDHVHQVRDSHEDIFRALQVEMYLRSAEQAA